MDVREIDTRLLKHAAVTQHAATSAAAGLALPVIFLKLTAVNGSKLLANCVLQLHKKRFDLLSIRFHLRLDECAF
ncbi:hypothetical protein D3C85_1805410 [compost metagenome]